MSNAATHDIESFVRKNYSDVYRYLYHRTSSAEDAQDMTQETFLRYVRAVEEAELSRKGRSYLFTIARNVSIDYFRAKKPAAIPLTLELEEVLTAEEPADDGFSEAVAQLPEDLQEVLSLKYAQGFGVNEIAEITGLSRFAVRRKIKRAFSEMEDVWEGHTS